MEISEELLLNLVEAVKKLMVKNLRMEEYIRSLPRAERAEFSLENERFREPFPVLAIPFWKAPTLARN